MLCLHLKAPFAVFRNFTAGSFRPTTDFITPSAAYGLLLNIAGIEMRKHDPKAVMTLIQSNLPRFRVALGALDWPSTQSLYQQLHNYPVGTSGKEHKKNTMGSKYNITPARRSFLSGIKAYICMDGLPELEEKILTSLQGTYDNRYGTLFLGDNNFLPDRIEPIYEREPAYWYEQLTEDTRMANLDRTVRLTISIDRHDMSKTSSSLFRPTDSKIVDIPDRAWVEVGY